MLAKPLAVITGVWCLAFSAIGCSSVDFRRIAPPGIYKYEELAGDQPASPEILDRIDERRRQQKPRFPRLSDQRTNRPAGLSAAAKSSEADRLIAERDRLLGRIVDDIALVQAERATPPSGAANGGEGSAKGGAENVNALETLREDLARKVQDDQARARAERQNPVPQPEPRE